MSDEEKKPEATEVDLQKEKINEHIAEKMKQMNLVRQRRASLEDEIGALTEAVFRMKGAEEAQQKRRSLQNELNATARQGARLEGGIETLQQHAKEL